MQFGPYAQRHNGSSDQDWLRNRFVCWALPAPPAFFLHKPFEYPPSLKNMIDQPTIAAYRSSSCLDVNPALAASRCIAGSFTHDLPLSTGVVRTRCGAPAVAAKLPASFLDRKSVV
jgi:hypothetical protein